ncbi:MAG TPA: hypothetical protein VGI98_08655 [Candidatus Limnocylindrales bacterium]
MTIIRVAIEAVAKRAFASAVDWPGWSRSAKSRDLAIEALLAYQERYARVAQVAGMLLPRGTLEVHVDEEADGGAATEFGVPGAIAEADREPLDVVEAARRSNLVAAAWRDFDAIAAAAPEALRKGPRGGGRDRTKVVEHVVLSDHGYCRELGLRLPAPDPADAASVAAMRDAMLEVLRRPSDGSPIEKRWPARYAHRRIAWHALDHAWEIEDRDPRNQPPPVEAG